MSGVTGQSVYKISHEGDELRSEKDRKKEIDNPSFL